MSLKTKPATQHSPGIPGWKWASGLKPRKGDKYLFSWGEIEAVDADDLRLERYPEVHRLNYEHAWCGYIRRVRKSKPKKPQTKLPKARVMFMCAADIRETEGTPSQPIEAVKVPSDYGHRQPVAVIPCATRKQAAALVAKHNRRASK